MAANLPGPCALTKFRAHTTVPCYMGGNMEKLLVRLAQQLDAIDEASLMSLWSKYATTASRFEPTKRWEEATLIFSLIQANAGKTSFLTTIGLGRRSRWARGLRAGSIPCRILNLKARKRPRWPANAGYWSSSLLGLTNRKRSTPRRKADIQICAKWPYTAI